jgi:hypothetical protein
VFSVLNERVRLRRIRGRRSPVKITYLAESAAASEPKRAGSIPRFFLHDASVAPRQLLNCRCQTSLITDDHQSVETNKDFGAPDVSLRLAADRNQPSSFATSSQATVLVRSNGWQNSDAAPHAFCVSLKFGGSTPCCGVQFPFPTQNAPNKLRI